MIIDWVLVGGFGSLPLVRELVAKVRYNFRHRVLEKNRNETQLGGDIPHRTKNFVSTDVSFPQVLSMESANILLLGYTQPLVLFSIWGAGPSSQKAQPPPKKVSKEERGKERTKLTFSSIQALNACSTSPHLVALNPDDAQHPSTDDITVRHGLASLLPGLRIFNLRSGGSRIAGVLPVVSGITVEREGGLRERVLGGVFAESWRR